MDFWGEEGERGIWMIMMEDIEGQGDWLLLRYM